MKRKIKGGWIAWAVVVYLSGIVLLFPASGWTVYLVGIFFLFDIVPRALALGYEFAIGSSKAAAEYRVEAAKYNLSVAIDSLGYVLLCLAFVFTNHLGLAWLVLTAFLLDIIPRILDGESLF